MISDPALSLILRPGGVDPSQSDTQAYDADFIMRKVLDKPSSSRESLGRCSTTASEASLGDVPETEVVPEQLATPSPRVEAVEEQVAMPAQCSEAVEEQAATPTQCGEAVEEQVAMPAQCSEDVEEQAAMPTQCGEAVEEQAAMPTQCGEAVEGQAAMASQDTQFYEEQAQPSTATDGAAAANFSVLDFKACLISVFCFYTAGLYIPF